MKNRWKCLECGSIRLKNHHFFNNVWYCRHGSDKKCHARYTKTLIKFIVNVEAENTEDYSSLFYKKPNLYTTYPPQVLEFYTNTPDKENYISSIYNTTTLTSTNPPIYCAEQLCTRKVDKEGDFCSDCVPKPVPQEPRICDCGAEKALTTHAYWCSVLNK